jgi:hypothetical protein
MRFEPVDRVPFWDYGYWKENLDVWKAQGLPAEVTKIEDYLRLEEWTYVPAHAGMAPGFDLEVLEEDDLFRLVRDRSGITKRESKTGSSIPQFLDFPVKGRKDWEAIKDRFDPDTPDRFPEDWADRIICLNQETRPLFVGIDGFFWQLRQLCGLEGLSLLLYDDPDLVLEIQERSTDVRLEIIRRVLDVVKVDGAWFSEDMSYNKGPLLSPAMYRRFILPFYKRVTKLLRDRGVDIVVVDSDGNVNELVPLFIESGVTAAMPFEVRAGNDVREIRRLYPRFGMIGGIDKMKLIQGRAGIDGELAKMRELLPLGGFIPTVDHRVPPDVPYENYLYYLDAKWRIIHDRETYRPR